jgi:hypothetical protein
MRNLFSKLFNKNDSDKIAELTERLEILMGKIDSLSEKLREKDDRISELNPNRRFFFDTQKSGYGDTVCVAIRDRKSSNYRTGGHSLLYEDKDIVYYQASEFTGNNYFISYHTPLENYKKAHEIEIHFDALEKLGVLDQLVLIKK